MTQEKMKDVVSKLLIDDPSNFKFHAAYLAYLEAWEENPSDETRIELNRLISSLNVIDGNFEEFYANLGQFRKQREFNPRFRIQSQRKSDWRRTEKRDARNSRYR